MFLPYRNICGENFNKTHTGVGKLHAFGVHIYGDTDLVARQQATWWILVKDMQYVQRSCRT